MDVLIPLLSNSIDSLKASISQSLSVFENPKKLVIITSGGTKVQLSRNKEYHLENFSTGTRGAFLAKFFYEKNFPVLFVTRKNSKQPEIQQKLNVSSSKNSEDYLKKHENLSKIDQNISKCRKKSEDPPFTLSKVSQTPSSQTSASKVPNFSTLEVEFVQEYLCILSFFNQFASEFDRSGLWKN